MAKFNAMDYRQFRPFYPHQTFDGLRDELLKNGFSEPFQIADIGCGTGHSAMSFLKAGWNAHIVGIDPDIKMLEQAQAWANTAKIETIRFQVGSGEQTGLSTASQDALLVGSAFHWMDSVQAKDEFARILKPLGIVRIFEYQFPKARNFPEMNEWIRRQFNLYWKAPSQKPRGTLAQMTEGFRNDKRFHVLSSGKPTMSQVLDAKNLAGLLFSQSRVLCYEETLSLQDQARFRNELEGELQKWMGNEVADFDFKLSWHDFRLFDSI
jgi:ubiquinone/menaquinone biosynthesis C-methylase UbiE